MSSKPLDAEALDKENLLLHRKLAGAEFDAHTAWSRYEAANRSRQATEVQLEKANIEKVELAQKLSVAVSALQDIDHVMQILYEGGFNQQVQQHQLADRAQFAKILGLAQTWLRVAPSKS
jgi:hypothetical protein